MKKRKRERFVMRVMKGALVPADDFTRERLRQKKYRANDIVCITIAKARRYDQLKRAHLLGQMVVDNIESFDGLTPHEAIKRLQLEGNVACDTIALLDEYGQGMAYRLPVSLSFESMEEGEFQECFGALCAYLARRYWPELDGPKVAEMIKVAA